MTVIHASSGGTFEIDGTCRVIYSTQGIREETVTGSITLKANESVVLRKVD